MITQCRESEQHASTDRKCAIQMGGEFIRSQRHLLVANQCKVSAQLPHRALISCIQRKDGTELELITRGLVAKGVAVNYFENKDCELPIPAETLRNALSRIGVVGFDI